MVCFSETTHSFARQLTGLTGLSELPPGLQFSTELNTANEASGNGSGGSHHYRNKDTQNPHAVRLF
jgi:hypothetical protein